jgi:DNA-binding transcriptional regulator YiaG
MLKKIKSPSIDDLRNLKNKNNLSMQDIAAACMASVATAQAWMTGRRTCPPLSWWMLNWKYEKVDITKERKEDEQ